jgi:hypothetical protein
VLYARAGAGVVVIGDCSWGNKKPAAEAALGSTLAHPFESTQTGTFRLTVCQAILQHLAPFFEIMRKML